MWYAGIDAGGTQTKLWLLRHDGKEFEFAGRGTAGPGNMQDVGPDGLVRRVQEALAQAAKEAGLAEPPRLDALVIGAAGIGRPADVTRALEAFGKAFPGVKAAAHNDAIVALAGGTLGDPGAVVIAGTGSTAWAYLPDGAWIRTGGWGYILGDEGSGFAIGLEALRRVTRASDGRETPTSLTQAVLRHYNIQDVWDLIPLMYGGLVPKQLIAGFTPVVLQEAEAGDEVAMAVVKQAVDDVTLLVAALRKNAELPSPCPLVVVGGLFSNQLFFRLFQERIEAQQLGFQPFYPALAPAAGACAMALRLVTPFEPWMKEALIEAYGRAAGAGEPAAE